MKVMLIGLIATSLVVIACLMLYLHKNPSQPPQISAPTRQEASDALQGFQYQSRQWRPISQSPQEDDTEPLLSIITWNVWFGNLEATKRYQAIIETFLHRLPSVICCQEVTSQFLDMLLKHPGIQEHYCISDDGNQQTLGGYGVLILWKRSLPFRSLRLHPLPSKMGRKLLELEVDRHGAPFKIATVHLESLPPYHEARGKQLRLATDYLRKSQVPSLLMGDFNFCSTNEQENKNIPADFMDVWAQVRPEDNGWTEDTHINIMRYNQKQKHKQVRFDRVLLHQGSAPDSWLPQEIELLGTEPLPALPDIWPSDHFGLWATFSPVRT